jgi:uncharacterized protein (TIGR02246 family)
MPTGMKTQIALGLLLLSAVPALAQTPPTKSATPGGAGAGKATPKPAAAGKASGAASGEEAVRQASAAYVRALAEGKPEAIAKFWTADGDYAGPSGHVVNARKALENGVIDAAGPRLTLKTESLRIVTPDVAQEDGTSELTPDGEKPIYRGHYSAVWVRQQGNWLLSSMRESASASHGDRLSELGWLVGEWEAEDGDATITISGNWIDNKVYLLREIVIERDGRVIHRVTQRTAWDPLTKRLKSWTFDADGGMGESLWTKQDDNWVVQTTGVTRDGQITSAKNVYSNITDNEFVLKSLDAQVGSASKPEFELHFKRVLSEE